MTMKKFIGTISAALAATALTASAGVDVDIVSAYVFRGATENDNVAIQPGFETDIFDGLATVGTWASFDTDSSAFQEIDLYLVIPLPLGEDSPVTADFVYTEYTFPGSEGDADREFGIEFGTAAAGLDLGLGIFYGIDGGIDSNLYLGFTVGYELDLAENIALDLGAELGYLDPDEGESGFSHLTLSAALGVVIPEIEFPISVGISYVIETDSDVLEVDEDLFFTLGFSL
jgi:uncharacterized protein (TIGR02001 family)